ncbi:GntR family transcriptional regulator [Spinactinospora alkalitolerans]|uniref:GntR family transcriptional regulator n=1 Tax=Spinactinospora alkalitolerans TaxID=687207 RepID=A0A852U1B0_9ACTN|nr:GntR family transcriptional regulator [Spinactinospora alkalitolerans]NYE47780.1 GntR family transcriptional regulator [Spinactinospora alkalitolerans]
MSGTERVPKYERLRRRLTDHIDRLPADSPLPTERELTTRYGVSRATVRQALDALEAAGLVYRVQGAGTFVAEQTVSKTLSLTSFSEDMRRKGLVPDSRVLVADETPADEHSGGRLRLSPGTPLIRLVRVRLADSAPMCLETTYLVAERVPGLLDLELTGSIYQVLAERYGVNLVRADQAVRSVAAGEEQAALLGLAPRAPALRMERVAYDERGSAVESTVSLYRADRYEIRFTIHREAT